MAFKCDATFQVKKYLCFILNLIIFIQKFYLVIFTRKLINTLWQNLWRGSFEKKLLPWFFKFASDMTTALPIFKLMNDVSWYSTTFLTISFTTTLHLFLLRIHCSVYIINLFLAGYCMCRWVSGLFNCKSRLIKFFHHFMWLKIIKRAIWFCNVFIF